MAKPISALTATRLNEIMSAIQIKPKTIKELCRDLDLGRRYMLSHLRKLLALEKVVCIISPSDRRYKVYRMSMGASLFTVEQPAQKPPKQLKKRGPKPGTKMPEKEDDRRIRTVAAQQVGIKRDALVAALFG